MHVPLREGRTIHHDIFGKDGAGKIKLRAAPKGTGIIAETIAQKAKKLEITKVYFDRGAYKYHGRVKILADELRKNGMEF